MDDLPYRVEPDVFVFRYIVSHSELRLRSRSPERSEPLLELCFEDVQRMELDPRFTGGLTLTPVQRHGDLDDSAPLPLLLLDLAGDRFGTGFVACSKLTVRSSHREGADAVFDRVLFRQGAAYSPHAVGGKPAEPGERAFDLPVLRRYAPEKRTAARFR